MDFKRFSKDTVKHIDKELKRLLEEWRKEVGKTSGSLLPLVDKFIKACEGGKRLRGTLVVLGYEIGKQSSAISYQLSDRGKKSLTADSEATPKAGEAILKAESSIIKIAAAYEIFHTAILAHDDIIDKSPLRRGQPTIYQALGGDHYAISQTICLGDIGFFLAVKLLTASRFPKDRLNLACQFFADTVVKTAVGEMLDVELPHLREERKKEDVIKIMKLKTAQYTISGPLVLGAILAGAESDSAGAKLHLGGVPSTTLVAHLRGEQLLKNLAKFGESLGIAFQIQDDILGVFGSEAEIGKSITSDMEEGKVTILFFEAFKNANSQQRKNLEKLYGRGKIDKRETKVLRQIFKETGALNLAKKQVIEYSNQAKKSIPRLTKDIKTSTLLEQMVEYLVERSK